MDGGYLISSAYAENSLSAPEGSTAATPGLFASTSGSGSNDIRNSMSGSSMMSKDPRGDIDLGGSGIGMRMDRIDAAPIGYADRQHVMEQPRRKDIGTVAGSNQQSTSGVDAKTFLMQMYSKLSQSQQPITIDHTLNGRTVISVTTLADDNQYVNVNRTQYNRQFFFPIQEVGDFEMHLLAATLPLQKLNRFIVGSDVINMNTIQFGANGNPIAELEFIELAGKYMRNVDLLEEQTNLPRLIEQFVNEQSQQAQQQQSQTPIAVYQQENINDDDSNKINIFGKFKMSSTSLIITGIVVLVIVGILGYFLYFRGGGLFRRSSAIQLLPNTPLSTAVFMDVAKYGAPPSMTNGM